MLRLIAFQSVEFDSGEALTTQILVVAKKYALKRDANTMKMHFWKQRESK